MSNLERSFVRRLVTAFFLGAVFFALGGLPGAAAVTGLQSAVATSLVAEEHDNSDSSDEDSEDEDSSDEDSEDEDSSDEDSEDEDSNDEDSDDESSDEPSETVPFTTPPTTDATDDITDLPTEDASDSSETGPSPLGWILLGGGIACAAAAVAVYRRNRQEY